MSDPLTDPRATDLLAARPDDVGALAAGFRAAAGESDSTASGLTAAQHDGTWTGRAADAFRRAIGRLPRALGPVRDGYAAVAGALAAYEPELSQLQSSFVAVMAEVSDTQARLRVTDTDAYRRDLAAQTSRAFSLLDEFATVRAQCRDAVAAAQRTAPVAPQPAGAALTTAAGPAPSSGSGGLTTPPDATGGVALSGAERARIQSMIGRADALLGTPYVSGGGHGAWGSGGGLDCSGFVSAVLRSGGYLNAPVTTEGFAGQPGIADGPGRFVTIYDRTGCGANEHVIIDLNGRFYESGGGSATGGAPFVHRFTPPGAYLASFNTVLHPAGL
jgi:cell wall-associated NlpC family hydrolase